MAIINAIAPIFVIALIGYLLARTGYFKPEHVSGLSRYVFGVAVPVLLFEALNRLEMPPVIDGRLLLGYYLATFTVYGLGMLVGRVQFRHSLREQGVFGMAASSSNMVLVGLPLVLSAFGEAGTVPLLLLLSIHGSLMALAVALAAELDPVGRAGQPRGLAALARRVLGNPLVLGLLLGLATNRLGLRLAEPLATTANLISRSVLPCALFMLGASLAGYRLGEYSGEAWALVGLKLVLQPLLAWLLVVQVFHVNGLWGGVAVLTAGLPTAVNVSIFANRYEACVAPVAAATLLSSVLAMPSLAVLLYWLL